jgi:hypothetical protein
MVTADKCDKCANSRVVISENGLHSICCLSQQKAVDCLFYKKNHFVSKEGAE